jgi:hypothetical protein
MLEALAGTIYVLSGADLSAFAGQIAELRLSSSPSSLSDPFAVTFDSIVFSASACYSSPISALRASRNRQGVADENKAQGLPFDY